jgi:Conserved mid region of cactin
MTHPKAFLSKLTLNQLEDLTASTITFEKTEGKLKSEFVNYWKGLRVLVNATIANKRGENVINSSFLPKVN